MNHVSVELHFLPRCVARGTITILSGGLSFSYRPLVLVGSRNVSLNLNATPMRSSRNACFKIAKASLYGGLDTIQSGWRDPSKYASTKLSVAVSTCVSAINLGVEN